MSRRINSRTLNCSRPIRLDLVFSALVVLLMMSGCGKPPDAPMSLYFGRLLQSVPPEDYDRKQLLNPASGNSQATVVQDLIDDGFRNTTYEGPLAVVNDYVVCEGVKHFGITKDDASSEYTVYLTWGGLYHNFSPFNVFTVEVTRIANCELLGVTGYRVRQGI